MANNSCVDALRCANTVCEIAFTNANNATLRKSGGP